MSIAVDNGSEDQSRAMDIRAYQDGIQLDLGEKRSHLAVVCLERWHHFEIKNKSKKRCF